MDVKRNVAVGVLGAVVFAGAAQATIVADSIREFSGTQGQDGWWYGWMRPDDDPGTFRPMVEFDGERWWVDAEHSWTMLGPIGGHANGFVTSGGATRDEQWAVRRWVSDVEGDLDIEMSLRKLNVNPSSNGVIGRLFVDGVEVWSRYAAGTDANGGTWHMPVGVAVGTRLDFVMDPFESNDWSDNAQYSAVITLVPGPGSLTAFAMLGFLRRRRR